MSESFVFDKDAVQKACSNVRKCFQLKDISLLKAAINQCLSYFEEEAIADLVMQIHHSCPEFQKFINKLPAYNESTIRERSQAELQYAALLTNSTMLNPCDISRAAALFDLLCAQSSIEDTAKLTLEFLVAINQLRESNDGQTAFSIKSRAPPATPKAHTVCGANAVGALTPVSERSDIGLQYKPIPASLTLNHISQSSTLPILSTLAPSGAPIQFPVPPQYAAPIQTSAAQYMPVITAQQSQIPFHSLPLVPPTLSAHPYQAYTPSWQQASGQPPVGHSLGLPAFANAPYHYSSITPHH